jgi:heterodisulfide reductase subunit C
LIRYNPETAALYREKLLERVKADVTECYQCGNCSAGCPAAFTFDYAPNQVMRMLQVGLVEEVLQSKAVQNCIQCLTCTARCPRNIKIAGIFEDLKTIAVAQERSVPEKAQLFNRLFIENIAKYGLLAEGMFLVNYNLKSGQVLNDAELGLPMVQKGKIEYLPKKHAGHEEVARIYQKSMARAKARERA